jgi:uncharacterized protein (TIGR02246 family)
VLGRLDVHHQKAASKADVERLIHALAAAWNHGDVGKFASFFTARAQYLTGEGRLICGREEIEGLVSGNRRTSAIAIEDIIVVDVSHKEARASFRWEGRDALRNRRRGTISCIVVKHHDQWLIDDLRNVEDP